MPPQILKSKSDKNLQNLLDSLAGREAYEKHDDPNYDEDTSATPPLNPAALYKIAEGLDLYHLLEKVVEDDLDIEKALEEISSMAGGDVEIGPVSNKKKKKPTIFREEDEDDVESMKEQVVEFLREKGPSSYSRISHRLDPAIRTSRGQSPALNKALRQLTDPLGDNRVGSYYKSAYAGSIYYLVPEQQHMVPGADPQASFLQEEEVGDISEEDIINYLKKHGPSSQHNMYMDMRASPNDDIRSFVRPAFELRNSGRIQFGPDSEPGHYAYYLIPEHEHLIGGGSGQVTMFEESEDDEGAAMAEQIVNYLKEHGPSKIVDIRRVLQPDSTHGGGWVSAFVNLKKAERATFYHGTDDRIYWYLVPEQQHMVPGTDPQMTWLEENGGISKEQLGSLKMQIRYYLIAWGPKQDKDIIHYITKQARGGHWEHVSEDELRKAVFTSFSELKREGHLAWRREVGSHGVKTNWWYLLPNHADLLSQAGDQEEMFFQEDRGVRGKPGSNYPSTRDADDRTNEEDPETGKTGNVGPKYKIAREQSEVDEVVNYLLDVGVFTG